MSAGTRWLVVGHRGMLGTDLMSRLAERPHTTVTGLDLPDIDIIDPVSVQARVRGVDVVVNCAAYTAVDAAEENEDLAFAVNATGPANLALACADIGARLVHISTDYVFSGGASAPYPEDAPLAPRSAYGRTKAAGEVAVRGSGADAVILRTAWLYGAHGPNFVRTMIDLESTRDSIDVVDDQRGQPTWSGDLADRIVACVDSRVPAGTYHATSSGEATWFDLARRVFEKCGADPDRVRPTTSEAFVRPAPRPAYSVLGHAGWTATGLAPLRDWSAALDAAWPTLVRTRER